ncbi:Phenazine biosynthesis PhzF protein [Sesbania bispinosa]|nr:Phenazine biosynthesis PhzF protein [Sesbania bispinosa]
MAKKPMKYFVVDAFTESAFKGNPAAVCFLEDERDDDWLQAVAAEFKISQTCYLTRLRGTSNPRFHLRWFSPLVEVKLCGHATLAASHILFSSGLVDTNIVEFVTLSGLLTAKKIPPINVTSPSNLQNSEAQDGFYIELDFPADPITEFNLDVTSQISESLNGASIIDIKRTQYGDDLLVELSSGESVIEVQPQIDAIIKCPGRGIIVSGSAPSGSGFDFYSRFFCPKFGVNEDPVCGSAHCALASYWSKKLGKCDFNAYQASARGGVLNIHLDDQKQRVFLRGKAVTVMEGVYSIDVEGDAGKVTDKSTVNPDQLGAVIGETTSEKQTPPPTPIVACGIDQSQFKGYEVAELKELAKTKKLKQLEVTLTKNLRMNFSEGKDDEAYQKGSESDNKETPSSSNG